MNMDEKNVSRKSIKIISFSLIAIILSFVLVILSLINQSNGSIESSGQTRRYILYAPDTHNPSFPTPLVISLHGFADWPAHHMLVSGWNEVADENGFLVVYPMGTGFPLRWLAHTLFADDGSTNPDIIFISDLIQKIKSEFNIDENHVYVNGLSNGAGMTHLLACELSDQIAAAGGVAGAYLFPWQECQPSRPVPAMLFHGTDDKIVPYRGGESERFDYPFPAIPDFAAQWAAKNGCDPVPQELPTAGEISGLRYMNCTNDAEVIFYTVHGGGHSWPGGGELPRWIVGHTSQDMNASEIMWEFYKKYSLEK